MIREFFRLLLDAITLNENQYISVIIMTPLSKFSAILEGFNLNPGYAPGVESYNNDLCLV